MIQSTSSIIKKQEFEYRASRIEDRVSVNQVPNLAPNSFSVVKSKITGLVERFGWVSGEGTVEYLGTWFYSRRSHSL